MAATRQIQSSELPPAQPSYVLRGHSAQIHAVTFLRSNTRLLTGDAEGFVVIWNTSTKRAVAVWKAHSKTVLGVASWEADKIITHGRDNKLYVWQITKEDEAGFSTTLPIDDDSAERKMPWLLHSLEVNALNFCSFAMTQIPPETQNDLPMNGILIGTPGVQDGHINITCLPNEERVATIPNPKDTSSSMLMAVGLHLRTSAGTVELLALAGYESGHVAVFQQRASNRQWQMTYLNKTHSQPVLSLSVSPTLPAFFTSSVDAIVARHSLSKSKSMTKVVQTRHTGQQGLSVRSDELIFATAGWDARVRVYSTKHMKELAVLKWHKEGCYALAFADTSIDSTVSSTAVTASDMNHGNGATIEAKGLTVAERRHQIATTTHWLAVGSKDGKVSLWDIY